MITELVGIQIFVGKSRRQMVQYLNALEYLTTDHLNSGQMDTMLFSYELVWYFNGRSST